MTLTMKCDIDNDLYLCLKSAEVPCMRYDSALDAVSHAPVGSGVMLLADRYPVATDDYDSSLLTLAESKNLRLYVEYPKSFPNLTFEPAQSIQWERLVVADAFFGNKLPAMTILAQHGCWFLPVNDVHHPHLTLARVAGYHDAVYGLPAKHFPVLFEIASSQIMIATTQLSRFITARYAPQYAWKIIWENILRWVSRSDDTLLPEWTPVVDTQYHRNEPTPESIEIDAFHRSVKWFREQTVASIDHKKFALEGIEGIIDYRGRQFRRTWNRADCTGETAMVLACDWALSGNPDSKRLAGQMLDYVWSAPDFYHNDPQSPAYGFVNWAEKLDVFYGDDNARVILPSILSAKLLNDERWDESILRCILANFRVTGKLGFRRDRLDYPKDFQDGRDWRYYRNEEHLHYSPHFQAYLWAIYLWLYAITAYEPLFHLAKNAIRMTMQIYPRLKWTNGLTQEMARLLLPVVWLVRIENTSEHRHWLDRVTSDLLKQMQPCGAIREMFGDPTEGAYPPPQSNETYGTTEASLIQKNGDPACDLLYTTNFAFLGLHESAGAIQNVTVVEAENRLANFLSRIQTRCERFPQLNGCWMRSFDYDFWEYYGSSADLGWGAWCVESGWTNTWIATLFALRQLNQTLFDLSLMDRFKNIMPKLLSEMLPNSS